MKLKYDTSADVWTEALPLGNGRLGAMVFGGVNQECLQLNEDTLWSGSPKEINNPNAKNVLPEVRNAISEGRYTDADQLTKEMMGPYTQAYLPFGNLNLNFNHPDEPTFYERSLNINEAIARVTYKVNGTTFHRETFISHPDQMIVTRLETDQPNALSFTASLESPLKSELKNNNDKLVLTGVCPENVDPNYYMTEDPIRYSDSTETKAMTFEGQLKVIVEDGEVEYTDQGIEVKKSSKATLLFTAATSFNGFDQSPALNGKDPHTIAENYMNLSVKKSYDRIKQEHIKDYQSLFNRMKFSLNTSDRYDEESTDKRVTNYGEKDLKLVELMFHYGRYLLISSSRPGTQPANLQGIWNDKMQAPWSSNYTLNINTEMNYWLAEACNLSECHHPLLDFIEELAINGEKTAETNYGCRGWTAHHNADLWRHSAPVGAFGHGDPVWALWPMSGTWLTQHLWEHYLYTGDESFLDQKAYPIMKGAANFCLDWLMENEDGYFITTPSTSPEHKFRYDGKLAAVTEASTMDLALIWDLFSNTIEAAQKLNIDEEYCKELNDKLNRLYPYQIGRFGQLQEWGKDFDDEDVHHRHVSHLFGVYPGKQITELSDSIYEAAKVSLDRRGDDGTGWSLSWKLCLWARFKNSERAHRLITNLFNLVTHDSEKEHKGGVYPNLFGAHPPFQIDGNFGFTAGVVEMLIQSHLGYLEFLPALPANWSEGEMKGVKVRGGFEVDFYWSNQELKHALIHSSQGNECKLKLDHPFVVQSNGEKVKVSHLDNGIVQFPTKTGDSYVVEVE
ncbi:glycosyl hydrolase family 95 catalytic domain-containing protein [Aquibacillus albus]|uniref:Alpha-L-fucosidase 2 n=1 Tax=Aquibacillus albus TaxID=1168171 RepID=A0ABS2MVS5_9BACI|nr:glycoside hydrolase family 95 protein [Aquibacillus albus]MBM7569987.1 alpha-L-fucosidase 2 [Aquibacillus albus]